MRTIFSTSPSPSPSPSLQYLIEQLNGIQMGQSESLKDFAQRIEKAYHELTRVLIIGKNTIEGKIHSQSVQENASSVFIGEV